MAPGRRRGRAPDGRSLLVAAAVGVLCAPLLPVEGYTPTQYFPPVIFQASYGLTSPSPAETLLNVSVAGWNVTTGVPAILNFPTDFKYKIEPKEISMVSAMDYSNKVLYVLASWRRDGVNQGGVRKLWTISYETGTPEVNETMPSYGCMWETPHILSNTSLPTCLSAFADGTLWAFNPGQNGAGGVVQILKPNSTVCPASLEGGAIQPLTFGIREYSSCVTCASPSRPDLTSSAVFVSKANTLVNFTHQNGKAKGTVIEWSAASGMQFDENKAFLISNQDDCSLNLVMEKLHLILEIPPPMYNQDWHSASSHYSVTRAPMKLNGAPKSSSSMLYSTPLIPSFSAAVPPIIWVQGGQVLYWDYDISQTEGFLINQQGISNTCSGTSCESCPPLLDSKVRFDSPIVPGKPTSKPPPAEASDPFCYGCWILGSILVLTPIYVIGFMLFNKFKNRDENDIKQLLPHREFWLAVPGYLVVGAKAFAGGVRGKLNEVKDKAPGILPHAASGTPRAGKTTPRAVFGDVEDGSFNSAPTTAATANAGEGYGTNH